MVHSIYILIVKIALSSGLLGPQVAVPPYFNPAVASGHLFHHYMLGPPQSMMSPYGTPYAVYPHGGVYAHPGVTLVSILSECYNSLNVIEEINI
ncbi:hypothetical protein LIER_32379 [Lithospermum erythrorhizon]|uniref:G-box binding protein multifunctional mosaic region domain-containing protein n=1 Tax=Lithospermum erythrorhizon TaxID=34254 RepID=A0AAV3RTN9_LITER